MKLWGGRFAGDSSSLMDQFGSSITFDHKLYKEDISGSIAHGKMLHKIGILSESEKNQIIDGLLSILADIEKDNIEFTIQNEDIHMNIEAILTERIGETAKKLHTARSRNDQVAVDLKMYVLNKNGVVVDLLKMFLAEILKMAEQEKDTIMPGYTHLQRAQPITFGFHMMAYFEMIKRDLERFQSSSDRNSELPLGAGALAGVPYATDREFVAELLGFKSVGINAMDNVSDRDFALEFLSNASILMMHLSRLSEEMILWATREFGFISLDDRFSTGSSIMPQKKNPDVAELIRGKTGRVYGNLFALLTVMKGLPLAYNKDMQEDKEPLFDTCETIENCLNILIEMLPTTKINREKMEQAVHHGYLNATDMADYLVSKGKAFREAHEITGKIVLYAEQKNCTLLEIGVDEFKTFCPAFDIDIYDAIEPKATILNKKSQGSSNPGEVQKMITQGKNYLKNSGGPLL